MAHATAVALVGEVAAALEDAARLRTVLDRLTVRESDGHETLAFACPERGWRRPSQVSMRPAETPRGSGLALMAHVINENMGGVDRELLIGPGGALISSFAPLSLLDAIWWLTADAVSASTIRACAACGRFFVTTHGRARFCPRPLGQAGASLCLTRYKQQQYRARRERGEEMAPHSTKEVIRRTTRRQAAARTKPPTRRRRR